MGRGKKKKNKGQNIAILDIINDVRTCDNNDDFIPAKAVESKKTISEKNKQNMDDNDLNKDVVDNINSESKKKITIFDKYFYIAKFLKYNWYKINDYSEIEPIIIEDSDSDEDREYYNYDEY
jgi:hypothetical protein